MPAGNAAGRLAWVDRARGLGIILVVVGHGLPGLTSAGLLPDTEGWELLNRWIYAFHMPLFFFVSGLFATAAARHGLGPLIEGKLRTIAWPYFVWSVLQTLAMLAVGGTNQTTGWAALPAILWQPIMQFWFLYALFVSFVVYGVLVRAGLGPRAVFAVAAALYLVPRFGSLGSWGVAYSVANHMIYFAAGLLVAGRVHGWLERLSGMSALSAAAGALALMTAGVVAGLDREPLVKPALATLGVAATALIAHRCESATLSDLGRLSLQIYVAHTLASAGMRIALARTLHVTTPWIHVPVGLVAGLALPLLLAALLERAGVRYAFTWPKN